MAGAASPHIPPEGTKQYELLRRLLNGDRVDPFTALMEINLPTVNARASELRRMGWPVLATKEPHPKLTKEKIVVFFFDQHFRRWITDNPHQHPSEYPGQEGRGKFARDGEIGKSTGFASKPPARARSRPAPLQPVAKRILDI